MAFFEMTTKNVKKAILQFFQIQNVLWSKNLCPTGHRLSISSPRMMISAIFMKIFNFFEKVTIFYTFSAGKSFELLMSLEGDESQIMDFSRFRMDSDGF